MQFLQLKQGSPEWLAWRSELHAHNASEAPVAWGCSSYMTRTELMRARVLGGAKEYSRFVEERVLARGHRIEARLRPLAEQILQQQLFPAVCQTDDGFQRASFDGLGMLEDESFEAKSLNEALRAALPVQGLEPSANDGTRLPLEYRIQCQQQLTVRGQGMRVLFMAGDEHTGDVRCCWYMHDEALAQQIVGMWRQWDEDIAAMLRGDTPAQPAPERPAPQPVEALPVVSVKLDGQIAIVSNLDKFGAALRAYLERLPKKPSTDQEFADCEDAVKRLTAAEGALKAAEATALSSVEDVQKMRATVAELLKVSSDTRKAVDALVKRRKVEIREEHVTRGRTLLQAHHDSLDRRLGGKYMPAPTADFAGAIRNLKKWDSLRDAVDTTLALAKVEANRLASDVIEPNLRVLRELVPTPELQSLLFSDRAALLLQAPEAFKAIVEQRMARYREQSTRQPAQEDAGGTAEMFALGGASPGGGEYTVGTYYQNPPPAGQAAQGATPAPQVIPMQPQAARGPLTAENAINMGQVKAAIAPLNIDSDGLAQLGFPFVRVEKGAKLYYRDDLPLICAAMIRHLQRVAQSPAPRAAAAGGGE